MSLRGKVAAFGVGLVLALALALFLVARQVLVTGFDRVEREFMQNSVQTFEGHMPFEYFEVASRIRELAPQNEAVEFAAGGNPTFVGRYLTPDRLAALNLSFVLFLSPAGDTIAVSENHPDLEPADLTSATFAPVLTGLTLSNGLEPAGNAEASDRGMLLVDGRPAIVSSALLEAEPGGSYVSGALVVGRVLDEAQVRVIEDLTHLDIELRLWNTPELTDDMRLARDLIQAGESQPVIALDSDTIAGYTAMTNVLGESVVLARVTRGRPVYAQAQQSQRVLLGLTVLVGALFLIVTMIGLQRGLLSRFALLSSALRRIGDDRDSSRRVSVPGQDELAQVADDVNTMLEALEQSEDALRESETRYALATTGSNDGIWDWDLQTDRIYYSRRWLELLGLDPDETRQDPAQWLGRLHPDDERRVRIELADYIRGQSPQFENEHRLLHADGTYRWVLVRGRAIRENEQAIRMAGSLTDITQRGLYDPLTGLPNDALLSERLTETIAGRPSNLEQSGAAIGIRIATLGALRESMGQSAVDDLICDLATRLRAGAPAAAMVARPAADRFVVVLEQAGDESQLAEWAAQIHAALTEPFTTQGRPVRASSHLGIVPDLGSYETADDVLRDVDMASAQATELREPVMFFDREMFEQVSKTRRLELDLRGAAERGELFLQFQPVVDLESGASIWYEALVRWEHPSLGLVSPGTFIPLAEDSGAIVDIGRWILRNACEHLSKLRDHDLDVTMSVNLSGRQILDPGLVAFVEDTMRDLDIRPEWLSLEVTETSLMQDAVIAAQVLTQLKALGVGIVMDDFGTGYSSLSYIHTLPLDKIKIDRAFVSNMTEDPTSLEIIRTIIGLARTLGLTVVPEGIEREAQAALLRDLGCEVGQGYLYDRPLDFADAVARPVAHLSEKRGAAKA